MKFPITSSLLLASLLGTGIAQAADRYVSVRQEIKQAIARGNNWLISQQKPEGYWDDPELPAFTALALNGIVRDPSFDRSGKFPEHIEKAFQWLQAQQKEDGGIYNRGLSVYNTATSITAMVASGRKDFEPSVVKARKHLVANQWDIGEKGKTDNPNDGGVGYGSKNDHTDLSNTYLAIEAMALSKKVVEDGKYGEQPDLNWDAALTFLSRCQNLQKTNDQEWANDDPKVKGGFVYTPGESKAETVTTSNGRVALRSYGSMSYAGLLSLIYAKVTADDPRVVAVLEWLGDNYTLEENPGMGAQGLYYYYQAMAKALTAAGVDVLKLKDGRQVDWRKDLANSILTQQRENGSWVNNNGRFMESNPVLVTAYNVLALEHIYDSIPEN